MENPQDERQRMEEDASIGIISSVVCMPVAAFFLENTVSLAHTADKYGWRLEGPGVVVSGLFAVALSGYGGWQWRKFHKLRDQLLNL